MGKKRETNWQKKPTRYFDYSLLFIIIFLVCFGLVMLYSTSSYDGQLKFDDSAYYEKAVVCNKPRIHGNVSDIQN